jgi:acetylglutamate kinase
MKQSLNIVKVGGAILEDNDSLKAFTDAFAEIKGAKLLIHGGGRSATRFASRLGIETTMVNGRRITDDAMLEVVTMVYGGDVNRRLVASLQSLSCNAIGLTGADLNLVTSRRRPPVDGIDYGNVGDVVSINSKAFKDLLSIGAVPVIAPLTHDMNGHLLNTNADTMAGEIASGLAEIFDVTLTFCFEKNGVLSDSANDDSVIPLIDRQLFARLREEKVVEGGMIPKLDNAFKAIDRGVRQVKIIHYSRISTPGAGTTIV